MNANNEPRLQTCPKHPTTHLRAGGVCPLCERIGRAKLSVVEDQPISQPLLESEGAMPVEGTLSVKNHDGSWTEPVPMADVMKRMEDLCDPATGELHGPAQMTLDPSLFPAPQRRDVPMVRMTFSGSIDLTRADYGAYCTEQLSPGRMVSMRVSGYVPAPHAAWVKRTEGSGEERRVWHEQEGRVKVLITDIGAIEVGGEYGDE